MARPKKAEDERADVISIRISAKEKKLLDELRKNKSRGVFIRELLQKAK